MRFAPYVALFLALVVFPLPTYAQDAGALPVVSMDAGSVVVPIQPPPPPDGPVETVEDAADLLDSAVQAAKGGHWTLFIGMVLMLLVWVLDRLVGLKDKVGKKAVPWVAALLGLAATVGLSLASGQPVGAALLHGFTSGATAVGLWEMLGKLFLQKPEPSTT